MIRNEIHDLMITRQVEGTRPKFLVNLISQQCLDNKSPALDKIYGCRVLCRCSGSFVRIWQYMMVSKFKLTIGTKTSIIWNCFFES